MTGPQLEKCLQGGQDTRDLIILLMELLDQKIKNIKRIFVSPLDKVKGFPMLSTRNANHRMSQHLVTVSKLFF